MKISKILFSFLAVGLIASCGPTSQPTTNPTIDPTVDPTVEPSEDPTSEEPTGPITYVSLEEAVANTENNYSLFVDALGRQTFIEAYTKDCYINSMQRTGYIHLDNDPGYTHQLDIKYDVENDYIKYYIDVYGRVGGSSIVSYYEDYNFFATLNPYIDTFDGEEGVYKSHSTELAYRMKDFFQNNGIKYCNEFIIKLNGRGLIDYFECYEAGTIIYSFKLTKCESKNDVELYKEWKNKGSIVNERLMDYKFLYQTNPIYEPRSVYEGEEVTFEGAVSAIDTNNNLYVGIFDETFGYVSMKVEGKAGSFKEMDTVKVTGKVKTENQTAFIEDATVVDLGKKSEFLPVYDEEAIVDLYGGGTYAVNLFLSNPPVFSSSVYSTYGYVKSYEEKSLSEDTSITVVFATYKDQSGNYFSPELVIPKNLSSDKKDEIYKTIKNADLFTSKGGTELSIEKVIVEFDPTSAYGLKFIATESTVVSKKMSASEKIQKFIGLENFPILGNATIYAFTFGGFQGMILEDYYNITNYNEATKGMFISYEGISQLDVNGYLSLLTNYGYHLIEETKDIYGRVHGIYQLNDQNSYLAITTIKDDYEEDAVSIEMWVYNREAPLLPALIEDKLEAVASDILDLNTEFVRKTGTYDADYMVFELDSYAGKVYKDKPLIALTVNSEESTATNYAKQLIQEKGYKQYKVNNKPYSYNTRGQAHLVLVSPDGTFVDLACYPTTDYTYSGHDEFVYRIEVLIYNSEEPISVKTYDNLDIIVDLYASIDESLDYRGTLTLPEDTKVEFWKDTGLKNIDYGFNTRDEVFIYTDDLATAWNNIKQAIEDAGYSHSYGNENRAQYSKTINGEGFYIGMLYEPAKGYIRLMHDVLGAAFF